MNQKNRTRRPSLPRQPRRPLHHLQTRCLLQPAVVSDDLRAARDGNGHQYWSEQSSCVVDVPQGLQHPLQLVHCGQTLKAGYPAPNPLPPFYPETEHISQKTTTKAGDNKLRKAAKAAKKVRQPYKPHSSHRLLTILRRTAQKEPTLQRLLISPPSNSSMTLKPSPKSCTTS